MNPKLNFPTELKLLWFGIVSLLLGPFTLWFALVGKKRRRGLEASYFQQVLALLLGFIGLNIFLFLAPLHWMALLGLYVLVSSVSSWLLVRGTGAGFFTIGFESPSGKPSLPWDQSFIALGLAIYPLVYIFSLLHYIGDLDSFSIRLPSDVYTNGLLWMLYATPGVVLSGYLAWKASIKPTLRSLIYFYAALVVVLAWLMVWEKLDQFLLTQFYGYPSEPMLFTFPIEVQYRTGVKIFFYSGAFILGIGYLVKAARTSVFIRRAVFLGLPSMLLYGNLIFALGDWNQYLAGIRNRVLDTQHYGLYRLLARTQLARTPNAYRTPAIMEEWSELEYQLGNRELSKSLLSKLSSKCGNVPYYSRLRKRADRSLKALSRTDGGEPKAIRIDLPSIKPADYLNQEWYSLLSAVAFLKPAWTDLELKKRLLDLSITVRLQLPDLNNVPELIPALRDLEIPVSACFLTKDRILSALASGHVPFISLYGHWVPISGYDPGRDGFYYFAYQAPGAWDNFINADTDLFYHHKGESFGRIVKSQSNGASGARAAKQIKLLKFIPTDELLSHILDIGGVGMVLGDSTVGTDAERRAAFLLEQGDVYYQEHENYEDAAECYQKAGKLFPNEQVYSRMLYLKRRYWEVAADPGDYRNLFRDYPPEWLETMGLDAKREKALAAKVLQGELGTYLMLNWYVEQFPDSSSAAKPSLDTAITLFTRLHEIEPEETLYTDSLASLTIRRGDYASGEKLYTELTKLYPFGSELSVFKLAWVKLKLGKLEDIPELLARCTGYAGDAKYLALQGAVAIHQGRFRSAHAALSRSLKLDKTIGETHALMEAYYRHTGDKAAKMVHHQWQRRST